MPNPLVTNAASKKQVQKAQQVVAFKAERDRVEMIGLLEDPRFRRFLWNVLELCHVHHSIWDPSARIHYNAGQQDIGHAIMAQILEARPSAYLTLMEEHAREEEKLHG